MKAAIYCRISADKTGEAAGVTRQQEDCHELAAQLGWEVVEVYVDNDISAASGKPRPAYRKMLADIDAGHVHGVIAWHPDRIYRRAIDLGELVEVCKRNNTQIATVKAGTVDLTTPTGRMIAGILAQVATYEGEAKSDRWQRSVRQRREAGVFAPSGPRMFGYTRTGEVVAEEAAVARWMAAQVLEGVSVNQLCRDLTERGVASSTGRAWQPQTVTKFLANPKLAGYATLNGDIIGDGDWEPILDRDTWEQVRALLTARRRGKALPRVALLPGLIYCGRCKAPMVTGSRVNKGKRLVRTYRCSRLPQHPTACRAVSGVADKVEEVVEAYAEARWLDPRVQQRQSELRGQPPAVLGELSELEGRITELEQQLDTPGVPVEALLRAIDRAKTRIGALQEQLLATPAATYTPGAPWPEDLARRRALVEAVVERVFLDPATVPSERFDPKRIRIDRREF